MLKTAKWLLTFGWFWSCPYSLIHIKYFFSLYPNVLKPLVICVDAILKEFTQCYRAGEQGIGKLQTRTPLNCLAFTVTVNREHISRADIQRLVLLHFCQEQALQNFPISPALCQHLKLDSFPDLHSKPKTDKALDHTLPNSAHTH